MAFIEAPTNFYLGRVFDPRTNKMLPEVVYYDSRDLTTHAVVVGMTGSGKTGLCINMLEEAILDNIPAIIIDPKGDITNLALVFPELQPENFKAWLQEDDARRAGLTIDHHAANTAQMWREGLEGWGIVPDRLRWLKLATKLSIYTPGSDAGLPISILASLRAPQQAITQEALVERIHGVVTALFTLAGMNFLPTSTQYILVSNIIEHNWRSGRDLTVEDIILQIKQPPFARLGASDVDTAINEKTRYKLAMELNNIIASPSYKLWVQGDPLDIQSLLYQKDGRPRVSIFYTAHLNDQERMFITTLILESMIAWMRTQNGTSSLRAILYIDEMFGYFPPYPKNPPTKEPIMRLLKQARAFGIGLILATQNPGDLDYKGLTNAGTWFIGRLSSPNDKERVMAGLQSIAVAGESMDNISQLISDIQPRVFVMRNVHNPAPLLVHSRWAMSYLAGPLTRNQIAFLMQGQRQALAYSPPPPPTTGHFAPAFAPPPPPPVGFSAHSAPPPVQPMGFTAQSALVMSNTPQTPSQASRLPGNFMTAQPPVKSEIAQFFLPTTRTAQQALSTMGAMPSGQVLLAYVPMLLAQVAVRYQHRASQVYLAREYAYHVPEVMPQGLIHWEQYQAPTVDTRGLTGQPFGQALFQEVPAGLLDPRRMTALQRELVDMVANTARLTILFHPQFKLYQDPNRDVTEFYAQAVQIAREKRDDEMAKLVKRVQQDYARLKDQYDRKARELNAEQIEISDRKREQLYTTGEALMSLFRGQTNYTVSRMSRATRMKRQTEADLQESREVLGAIEAQMQQVQQYYHRESAEIDNKWTTIAQRVEEYVITPFKKDISISLFGIGWIPHYYMLTGTQPIVVSAFG